MSRMAPMRIALGVALATVGFPIRPAFAQAVDPSLWVANGPVYAVARSGNTLYLGGNFTQLGPASGAGVPIDAATGAPAAGFPKVAGIVRAVAPDGAGGWFIAGTFAAVGGIPRTNLAHVLANNSVAAWDPSASNPVHCMAVSGSAVYVGGRFTSVGGQPRSCIAALDAGTGLATAWDPSATGGYPGGISVDALAVSGATVYAGGTFSGGGTFSSIGGQARNYIAALDAATGLATAWNPNANGSLSALAVSAGTVYAGGVFSTIGGQTRNRIAALDAGTGIATAWNPNANLDVRALEVSGTTVYAGGSFTSIGGQTRNGIAALDATSGLAAAWNPSVGVGVEPSDHDGTIYALATRGSTLYAGGWFTRVGSWPPSNLAAIAASPALSAIAPATGGNAGPVSWAAGCRRVLP